MAKEKKGFRLTKCHDCGALIKRPIPFCPRCGTSIRWSDWELQVSGTDATEVEKVTKGLVEKMSEIKPKRLSNPWISGSFYLFATIVLGVLLLVISKVVHVAFLPIVIIGALLIVSIVGALQLRQDEKLSQKNFLTLMIIVLKQIPFLRKKND